MYSLNHNWAKFEYSTSTDTDIWRQNLSILSSTSVSLWRHQNCYVYTWNAKGSMYLFHSDLGNTVHDSIFGETTAQLVLTSKQFSECTEHINLWHLQTTSTWGKGGIKNSMKNTEKRFLLVGTYHENKTRWITLYSQSFNIVKLSCYIFKRLNQFVLRVLAMLFTHNFYLLWLYFGDEQFCDPWFFLKPNQW